MCLATTESESQPAVAAGRAPERLPDFRCDVERLLYLPQAIGMSPYDQIDLGDRAVGPRKNDSCAGALQQGHSFLCQRETFPRASG